MSSSLFNPKYWREKAEEARAQAEQMTDWRAKRSLLGIADNYEQLADRQAQLVAGSELAIKTSDGSSS